MSKNFEALAIARANSASERKLFEFRMTILGVAVVVAGLVALLLQQVPAATWNAMQASAMAYSQAFLAHGKGLVLSFAFILFVLLYRDSLTVKALRRFHEESPDAPVADTTRWLVGRQWRVWLGVWGVILPMSLAAAVVKGAVLLLPMGILASVASRLLCEIYAPIGSPDAWRGDSEKHLRQARNNGYMRARFSDSRDLENDAEAYPEGPVRQAYLDGLNEGWAMRAKLRCKGVDVDAKGSNGER